MIDDDKRYTLVPLKSHYNLCGITLARDPGRGKLDEQFAMVGEELPGTGPTRVLDVLFDLPEAGGEKADNCMIPERQNIPVSPGSYTVLYILGNSVIGSSSVDLHFIYEAGSGEEEQAETLIFTDWCNYAQFDEQQAIALDHRYSDAGPEVALNFVWMQVIYLQADKKLTAIRFGESSNMRILGLTLGCGSYALPEAPRLRYITTRLRTMNCEAAQFDRLYYTLRDLQELGNDEKIGCALDAIRSDALEVLSLQDHIAYDASKVTGAFEPLIPRLEALHADATNKLAAEGRKSPLNITLVGHSHLDAVWLWPWNITVEKAYRTFSSNVKRLDDFEGATFAQSSPLFYHWMEQYYPDVFEGIKRHVKAGRWELVGGMWIEPDGNMPCGEALVRQRLYGQRYYLKKFGCMSEVAWIPDTFGMHNNHPQIIKKTGGRYFFTTKLMWNYENKFPYQLFQWEAPDGSRVLALQSAVGCGASPGPHDLDEAVRKHNLLVKPGSEVRVDYRTPYIPKEKQSEEFVPDVLSIYGEGDGGEGPSEKMYLRALTLEALPGFTNGRVHDYFHHVEKRYGDRLPVWRDELYLENHRGTTSSQGRIKELNRKAEAAMLTAEKWSTLSRLLGGFTADAEDMERAWKKMLFNQFHDILPGTSVPQAYVDAELDFDDVFRVAKRVRLRALRSLASRINTRRTPLNGRRIRFATGRSLILFNPLMWERSEVVKVPWEFPNVRVADLNHNEIPSQVIFRDGRHWLLFHATVPAFGYTQVRLLGGKPRAKCEGVRIEGRCAENRFYRLELNENGHIERLFDKERNKDLLTGPGNRIRFFRNRPREWSNWNINPEYEKHELHPDEGETRIEVMDNGPVTAAFRITSPSVDGGRVVQEIRLYALSRRIDFVTDLDVNFRESLIKAVFPLDSDASHVTTETAYGIYERPLEPVTDFEKAKWEVWTQKWLDLSGSSGGITFMNSAKYGFDTKGYRLSLTLVKGGVMPDPHTDVCTHRIDFALEAHDGSFQDAHAWKRGCEYNFPIDGILEEEHEGDLPLEKSFCDVSEKNICWEVLKPEEEGQGFVIRVYEVEGRDVESVKLTLPVPAARVEEIDFLELEVLGELPVHDNQVTFSLGHNEIKALRFFK
ncbi:MAG: glycoside hydrolase family 38 C-terminal domain-containing protein [Planctomycetota bacterium]